MKRFMILSIGFEQPTQEVMQKWNDWFKKLEEHTVEIGSPFTAGVEINLDGSAKDLQMDQSAITGYRIIQAESLEQAKEIAKGSPSIGGIRIYELMKNKS